MSKVHDFQKRVEVATGAAAQADDHELPEGWTEASPGGMATNPDPLKGGIIDRTAEIDRLANEAGKPVRVVQTLELRDATPDELAVLKNAVEQGRHTQGSIAKAYIKSADSTGEVLAVIQMQDGPHADSHQDGDDTRHTLQVAFSHVFGREVSVVFETDIPTSSDPGLVFIP